MVWRVVILVALGLVNLVLFVHMLWGGTGLMEYADLRRQLREAQEQVAELDRKNVELSNEIRWLQSDSQYLEKMIRQRLHYVRDNEIIYLFSEKHTPTSGAGKQ